jgi:hypothetical protein
VELTDKWGRSPPSRRWPRSGRVLSGSPTFRTSSERAWNPEYFAVQPVSDNFAGNYNLGSCTVYAHSANSAR